MDFLDPKKKKAHKRQLYLGYFLVSVAIIFAGVVLLFAAFGYGIDRQGNVVQNGLVFVASTPEAAEVQYRAQGSDEIKTVITNDRLALPAGQYNFEFLKQGYRPWQRTLKVDGGRIERLTYPFLFPEDLKTVDDNLYSKAPSFSTISPDRSNIVVLQPNTINSFDVINANDPEVAAQPITVPTTVLPVTSGSRLELIEWSNNNRHLLVKHVFQGGHDFVLIDTEEPANSRNLDSLYNVEFKQVTLFDKKPDQFYLLRTNNRLLRGTVSTARTERVLDNVLAYKSHGSNRLLYVQGKSTNKTVKLVVRGDDTSFTIRTLPRSPRYLLDLAEHQGNWYVVGGSSNDDVVYIYRDPFETLQADDDKRILLTRTLLMDKPQKVSFSENTQFIAVQHDEKFAVYDVYEDERFYYEFDTPFDAGAASAKWMDGHRLTAVSNKKVIVFDFDGSNYQVLSPIKVGSQPMFDRDYTRMFTIAPSVNVKGRAALTDTALRVTEN